MKRLIFGGLAAMYLVCCALLVSCLAEETAAPPAEPSTPPAGPSQAVDEAPQRPAEWAQPIEKPGLPNLHKVSDELYRGAQPTAEGMRELVKMGVKTVVNLRSFHSDSDEIGGTPLGYEHIWVKAWHAEDEDIIKFLQIVTDRKKTPVFVHCEYGADRTGMMVAVYRIAVQGWTKGEALGEMTKGGFGWHKVWENLADHIRKMDVEALKKKAGLVKEEKPAEPTAAGE
jgi:protein tyrosine phosphatase (PTP) superfamily phosphohydrolase (DUF442 family)